jgi:hypothetical protein
MDDETTRGRASIRSLAYRVGLAAVAVAAAAFAVFFASVLDWLACESGPSEACDRKDLAALQFRVALAGLAPTLLFATALIARWRRIASAMLVLAAATYLVWAVLADAAHHGWDDLKFFPV